MLSNIRLQQIARRLAYMYKKRTGTIRKDAAPTNLLALFMTKLGAGNLKKPRQKIPFNAWAAQNKIQVDAEFAKRSVGIPAAQHAQLRSSVYKEFFEALPEHEQQAVIQEVTAQHALALIEYENSLKSGPSMLPQDRQRYVNRFCGCMGASITFTSAGLLNLFPSLWSLFLTSLQHILGGSGRALVEVLSRQRVDALV